MSRVACLLILLVASAAQAQTLDTSFDVQTFRLTPHGRGFFSTESGELPRSLELRAQLAFIYSYQPFEIINQNNARISGLVDHRFDLEFGASISIFGRFSIGLGLPATLVQVGGVTDATGVLLSLARASVGDLRFTLKGGVLTEEEQHVGLALLFNLSAPSGDERSFNGDRSVTFSPELALSKQLGPFRLGFNFGYLWRQPSQILDLTIGQELFARLGAGFAFDTLTGVPVEIIAEIFGRTSATAPFQNVGTSPAEWLVGARYTAFKLFSITAGIGRGIVAGYGSPNVRAFLALAVIPIHEKDPPPPLKDSDADGLFDHEDKCPFEPEDKDGFEDADGCPELDNDKDGIVDPDDKCPLVPEDRDGFEDDDGCPEDDNDKDGILDRVDACPLVAEDKDGFEDQDGCPELDNDKDGLLDAVDKCPNEPEVVNGVDDEDGCPDKGRSFVVLAAEQINISEKVHFQTNKSVILKKSFNLLEQVANLIKNHAEIKLVRVEGHTDERSTEAYNQKLSEQRAESVRKFLIKEGVAEARLTAVGYGESKPVSSNKTKRGREANRRVAFVILERDEVAAPVIEARPEPASQP